MRRPNFFIGGFEPLRRPAFQPSTELEVKQILARNQRRVVLRRRLEEAVRDGKRDEAKKLTQEVMDLM
jgi:hypothetical protein